MFPTSDEQRAEVPATAAPIDPRIARSRAKLIAAATEILVELGPRGLTVDAVAERSGVAKSTLYRHWPSRTALMVDVLRENMPQVEPVDLEHGFEPCLRTMMAALADAFADPEWCRIMPSLFALKHQLPEIDDLTEADHEERTAMLRDVLAAGAGEGLIPPGLDPHDVISMLVGPILMCSLTGETDRIHRVAEFAVDRFLASYDTP
ncbi:MAG TPA: TetR/AcrR family transcriptional regulator [Ilumatobacter sp.]|nr:TetR/AcrR family transcriptional regulator [Ilumatobacter sp.]